MWFNGRVATVARLLEDGSRALPRREGIPDPRREASWLLARAAGVDETWLRIHPDSELPPEVAVRFRGWIARRAAGEPAHHLTGSCRFWPTVQLKAFGYASKISSTSSKNETPADRLAVLQTHQHRRSTPCLDEMSALFEIRNPTEVIGL